MQQSPKSGGSGVFCMVVKFETTENAATIQDQVIEWCIRWIIENNVTTDKPVILDEDVLDPYDYFHAFTRFPYVIKAQDNNLWLRFDVIPGSYWWKDWIVRVTVELRKNFNELNKFKASNKCDE